MQYPQRGWTLSHFFLRNLQLTQTVRSGVSADNILSILNELNRVKEGRIISHKALSDIINPRSSERGLVAPTSGDKSQLVEFLL